MSFLAFSLNPKLDNRKYFRRLGVRLSGYIPEIKSARKESD